MALSSLLGRAQGWVWWRRQGFRVSYAGVSQRSATACTEGVYAGSLLAAQGRLEIE